MSSGRDLPADLNSALSQVLSIHAGICSHSMTCASSSWIVIIQRQSRTWYMLTCWQSIIIALSKQSWSSTLPETLGRMTIVRFTSRMWTVVIGSGSNAASASVETRGRRSIMQDPTCDMRNDIGFSWSSCRRMEYKEWRVIVSLDRPDIFICDVLSTVTSDPCGAGAGVASALARTISTKRGLFAKVPRLKTKRDFDASVERRWFMRFSRSLTC